MQSLYPADQSEVVQVIGEGRPLEIIGGGSKRTFGHAVAVESCLSTLRLTGALMYEPDEMVLSVGAGTPMRTVRALLAGEHQRLGFEPPVRPPWLVPGSVDQTIGGVVACNLAGPQRLSAGAARDHLLGFSAVNGRGEVFKSGGRVVKNVTGYDLSKLMAGSFGTLAVLTELTLRTLPQPETEVTLVIGQACAATATRLFAELLGGPWEVAAAAWLPAALSGSVGLDGAVALVRLEGFTPSVRERSARLAARHHVEPVVLDCEHSEALWRALGNCAPLAGGQGTAIWKVSVSPLSGPQLLDLVPGQAGWLDWGGGLAWLAVPDTGDAGAGRIREVVSRCGGHATLVRASETTRARVPVFQPQSDTLAALGRRLKSSFDPHNLLNPGRMG